MDVDKDGTINKTDLRASFDNVGEYRYQSHNISHYRAPFFFYKKTISGRLMSDEELDSMLKEIGGPCNFDNMIKCFESKMAGNVNDSDDVIVQGIKCHDEESRS